MPSTPFSGTDRRKVARHTIEAKVSLKGRPRTQLEALDLSSSGVGLKARLRSGPGRTLDLVFLGGSLTVEGVVRYEIEASDSDFRIGVEFVLPQPELEEVALLLAGGQT